MAEEGRKKQVRAVLQVFARSRFDALALDALTARTTLLDDM